MWPQPSLGLKRDGLNMYSKSFTSQTRTWGPANKLPARLSQQVIFSEPERKPRGTFFLSQLCEWAMPSFWPKVTCRLRELEKGSPTIMANLPTLLHWKWGNRSEELQRNTGLRTAYVDVSYGSPGCYNPKRTKKNLVSSLQDDKETKVRYERKREERPVKMNQIDLGSGKPQNERIFHERQILSASCPIVQAITECLLCTRRCVISWGYKE